MKLLRPVILSLLVLTACGTSNGATEAIHDATSGGESQLASRTPVRPSSLAAVAMPADYLGIVRVGPLRSTLHAFGQLTGQPERSAAALEGQRRIEIGSDELAALADLDAGADAALFFVGDEPTAVISFQGPSMAQVVAALPLTWNVQARPDGSLAIPMGEGLAAHSRTCSVEPTADVTHTRIICGTEQVALDGMRQYLARSLDASPSSGLIRVSLAVESMRAKWGDQAHGGLALASTALDSALSEAENPVLRNPAVIAALGRLVRDVLDDLGTMVDEVSGLNASFTIENDVLDVHGNLSLTNASGSLVRAFAESLVVNAPVSEDLIRQLPPGAAVYAAGHWSGRAFDTFATEVRDLVSALVRAGVPLAQADVDALERGLAYAFRPMSYDFGVASGFDPAAQQWTVMQGRYASAEEATQYIDALRQMVTVFRRPTVARALDTLFEDLGADRPRFSQIAEIRLRGMPAGSYAVRTPPFEVLFSRFVTERLHIPAPTMPAPSMRETLVVPNGSDITVVQAPNASELYRSLSSAGGLGADIRTALLAPDASMNMVIRFGNIRVPNAPANHESGLPTMESVIGVEAGRALTTLRVRNSAAAPSADFEVDVRLEGVLLRGFRSAAERPEAPVTSAAPSPE